MDNHNFAKLINNDISWIGVRSVINKENVWTFENDGYKIEIYEVNRKIGYPNNYFSLHFLFESNSLQQDTNFGFYHYKLSTLRKWKMLVNRDKDQSDIALI